VAISTAFGAPYLQSFRVWTDQITEKASTTLALPDSLNCDATEAA
jgi:hypothetical protein